MQNYLNYKRTFIFIFFSLISSGLISQVVLKAEDMIKEGDTVRISIASDPNIDIETTGPQSVWDFSYLVASEQRLVEPSPVSSGGPLANLQFGSNAGRWSSNYYRDFLGLPLDQLGGILPIDIDDVYRFTRIDEDSITYTGLSLGVSGNILPFRSDTVEMAYKLPLTYGDEYTSRGRTIMNLNPFFDAIFIQYRQRYSVVDGYGSITTALGTFNAIRIHHVIEEQDSVKIDFGVFNNWIPINQPRVHKYEWWTKFQDLPLLRVEAREVGGGLNITEIAYRDFYLGLDASVQDFANQEIKLYPNPAYERVVVKADFVFDDIEVYAVDGRCVLKETFSGVKEKQIDVADWKQGMYHVFISSNGQKIMKKLVVQ